MTDEDKINSIKSKLNKWSFVVEDNIPEDLHELRNKCIYMISILDALLDALIGMNISFKVKEKLTPDERTEIYNLVADNIVGPINFDRKLEIAIKMKQITTPLTTNIKQAQNLRNAFAHPLALKYQKKLSQLQNKPEQLKEWRNLEEIAKALNSLSRDTTL